MKRFQRKIENFICEHCGHSVKGTGYTDHCPKCLWSRHVDINPGDREEQCKGLMKPVGAEIQGDSYIIHYKCLRCRYRHKVKAVAGDNFDKILELINHGDLRRID